MQDSAYKSINKAIPKKDAFSIMGGEKVYTEDLASENALVVKLARSKYASAEIMEISTETALKVPGVEAIFTYQDVPQKRFSFAGASFPGNNPMDRLILDKTIRFLGDPVAIVVADSVKSAEKACKLIKVKYKVLDPVIDFEKAEESENIIHPEDNFVFQCDIGGDLKHNILSQSEENGPLDFDTEYEKCEFKVDETYYTTSNQQANMETYRTYGFFDEYGMLTLITSTQIPFHTRRIVSQALGIPESMVRVIKPRIGGGFGSKQTIGTEVYTAFATWKTKKPCCLIFSRKEASAYTNARHSSRIRIRAGADKNGIVKALWMDSFFNAGAYSEHSVNVIHLSGDKNIPLYSHAKAWRFTKKNVFTNTQPGGAFRGFGATQGCFATESAMNKLSGMIKIDPVELRLRNIPNVGDELFVRSNHEILKSTALEKCIAKGKEMIGWDEKYHFAPFSTPSGDGKYRGIGMAISMQGSGISQIDSCDASIALNASDCYNLNIGASDMGTGCDTILSQMAAEVLLCDPKDIIVSRVDTSHSSYDKGSYASSTTYLTGNATVEASKKLLSSLKKAASGKLGCREEEVLFNGKEFQYDKNIITLHELSHDITSTDGSMLTANAHSFCYSSPPPFVSSFAEVEVDTITGEVKILDLVGVVDCGTVINKSLAKVQAEGGFVQSVGMALYEQSSYTSNGKLKNFGFMQYKIPSRLDIPNVRIEFEESYEPTGPFGAKSIGEVVINSACPAIISAIQNAVGIEIHSLPATPEKIWKALNHSTK